MEYRETAIQELEIPRAANPLFQHVLDTYVSETNKVVATWRMFTDTDLGFRPHPKSSTVLEIIRHQLLSERRFFAEFIGLAEPAAEEVLPRAATIEQFCGRQAALAKARLAPLAVQDSTWWLERVRFFDVERERIWVVWRRILHTAHHRTQLTMYLRQLDRVVPATYGPTADVSWQGADPTLTVEAAGRGTNPEL